MNKLVGLWSVVVLAGCDCGPGVRCSPSAPCPNWGTCSEEGYCVDSSATGGGAGGGSVGGGGGIAGGVGGAGGGGMSTCSPACGEHQGCVAGSCADVALHWVSPAESAVVKPGQVAFTVSATVGGSAWFVDGGVPYSFSGQTGVLQPAAAGTFTAMVAVGGADGPRSARAGWAAGPDAGVAFTVDGTGPQFSVSVFNKPTYPGGSATFLVTDPDLATAVRKDETVTIRVASNDTDVNAASFALSVFFDGGPTADGGSSTQAWTTTAAGSCDAGPFCKDFTLNMGPQAMRAFSGAVSAVVAAADSLGNPTAPTTTSPLFAVTRWKWAVQVSSPPDEIKGSPAIGDAGVLYVPFASSSTGGLNSVSPQGAIGHIWSSGPVVASPAIGRDGTNEYVSFQPLKLGLQVPRTGATCGLAASSNTGSPSIVADGTPSMRAVVVNGDGAAMRVRSLDPSGTCAASTSGAATLPAPGNMVTDSQTLFYPTDIGSISRYGTDLMPIGDLSGIGTGTIFGLSLFSSGGLKIGGGGGGAGIGRLFVAPEDGGTVTGFVNTPRHVSGVAVGSGPSLFAITQSMANGGAEGTLRKFDATGTTGIAATASIPMPFGGSAPGATTPVLGAGQKVYAVASNGNVLAADQATLDQQWAKVVPSALSGSVQASPTLDCSRDRPGSATGTLYFATTTGWLVAYIVDSQGLDPTAQWPKYQHDARNTGNSTVPIACP